MKIVLSSVLLLLLMMCAAIVMSRRLPTCHRVWNRELDAGWWVQSWRGVDDPANITAPTWATDVRHVRCRDGYVLVHGGQHPGNTTDSGADGRYCA